MNRHPQLSKNQTLVPTMMAFDRPLITGRPSTEAVNIANETKIATARRFLFALAHALRFVWPILSSIFVWQAVLGLMVTWLERWSVGDGLYFTFVTGLTIGYGDLVPRQPLSRFLAILIGLFGTVLTGLIAAIAVHALQTTVSSVRPPNSN